MNVIARLEYELAYYDSAVHRFNHYTTRTPYGRAPIMMELWEMHNIPVLPSLPDPLCPRVVASIGQTKLNEVVMLTELFKIELFIRIKRDLALNGPKWLMCHKTISNLLTHLTSTTAPDQSWHGSNGNKEVFYTLDFQNSSLPIRFSFVS